VSIVGFFLFHKQPNFSVPISFFLPSEVMYSLTKCHFKTVVISDTAGIALAGIALADIALAALDDMTQVEKSVASLKETKTTVHRHF